MDIFSPENAETTYRNYLERSKEYREKIFQYKSLILSLSKTANENLEKIDSISNHITNLQQNFKVCISMESLHMFQNRIQGLKDQILLLYRDNFYINQKILECDILMKESKIKYDTNLRFVKILEDLFEREEKRPVKRVRFIVKPQNN
jgi:hypothetical protein